jgi:hypothetical protein
LDDDSTVSRLLIAVLSCQRDRALGHHETIRQRWNKNIADVSDIRFFIGGSQPTDLLTDEVWLDVPDGYQQLSLKTKGICSWMLTQGYDFVFKCDCDTNIFPDRFKTCGYENFDYSGRFYGGAPGTPGTAAGGWGYFLSRKACEVVLNFEYPITASEDQMVGDALHPHIVVRGIRAQHLETSVCRATRGLGEPHSI